MSRFRNKSFYYLSLSVFHIQLLYIFLAVFHFILVEHRWCPQQQEFVDVIHERSAHPAAALPSVALDDASARSFWAFRTPSELGIEYPCPILMLFSSYHTSFTSGGAEIISSAADRLHVGHQVMHKPCVDDVLAHSPKISPPMPIA
jgi:hypothetical protein